MGEAFVFLDEGRREGKNRRELITEDSSAGCEDAGADDERCEGIDKEGRRYLKSGARAVLRSWSLARCATSSFSAYGGRRGKKAAAKEETTHRQHH